ncbi:MAG: hypothetical protein KDC86_18860, partial [Saprospiraceae bacterium]|nr:hypothetical protein [Saprospiraceae bacterium]
EFEIDLKYLTTVEELEKNLIDAISSFQELIKPESYYLRVAEVRKDNVAMKFQYILKKPNKEMERVIRKKAIRRLVEIITERKKFADKPLGPPDEIGHSVI